MKRLFLMAVVSILLFSCQQEKTAYVNSSKLFDDYQPIKDAKAKFKKQEGNIQSGMQSQVTAFQKEVQNFRSQQSSMSDSEKQAKQQELMKKQQQLQQMQQMQMQGIDKKRSSTMDSLNTAVKNAVADYAENNGYTYVFGMSDDSNQIVYASDGKNITDEVLSNLNDGEMNSSKNKGNEKDMKSKKEMDSTMAK